MRRGGRVVSPHSADESISFFASRKHVRVPTNVGAASPVSRPAAQAAWETQAGIRGHEKCDNILGS